MLPFKSSNNYNFPSIYSALFSKNIYSETVIFFCYQPHNPDTLEIPLKTRLVVIFSTYILLTHTNQYEKNNQNKNDFNNTSNLVCTSNLYI